MTRIQKLIAWSALTLSLVSAVHALLALGAAVMSDSPSNSSSCRFLVITPPCIAIGLAGILALSAKHRQSVGRVLVFLIPIVAFSTISLLIGFFLIR